MFCYFIPVLTVFIGPYMAAQFYILCMEQMDLSVDTRRLLPPRVSEVVGVSHLKCYMFDDDIIISGANISDTYFSNRQDRYFLVRNARLLANHIRSLVQVATWLCP